MKSTAHSWQWADPEDEKETAASDGKWVYRAARKMCVFVAERLTQVRMRSKLVSWVDVCPEEW